MNQPKRDVIPLSFKKNEIEQKLFRWLKDKLDTGPYIKDVLYREYLKEMDGNKNKNKSENTSEVKENSKEEGTKIQETGWEME